MAWPSTVAAGQSITANQYNALVEALQTWGGDVDANAHRLSNLASLSVVGPVSFTGDVTTSGVIQAATVRATVLLESTGNRLNVKDTASGRTIGLAALIDGTSPGMNYSAAGQVFRFYALGVQVDTTLTVNGALNLPGGLINGTIAVSGGMTSNGFSAFKDLYVFKDSTYAQQIHFFFDAGDNPTMTVAGGDNWFHVPPLSVNGAVSAASLALRDGQMSSPTGTITVTGAIVATNGVTLFKELYVFKDSTYLQQIHVFFDDANNPTITAGGGDGWLHTPALYVNGAVAATAFNPHGSGGTLAEVRQAMLRPPKAKNDPAVPDGGWNIVLAEDGFHFLGKKSETELYETVLPFQKTVTV